MAVRTYHDLEVFREPYSLALEVSRITRQFPRVEQVELARQLRRAARSVPANIVGGWARRAAVPEFKRYLQMAIDSCDETKMWLDLSRDEGYMPERDCKELREKYNRIGVMLSGLWRKWRQTAR